MVARRGTSAWRELILDNDPFKFKESKVIEIGVRGEKGDRGPHGTTIGRCLRAGIVR